ncbi:MAG TPA: MBL fold metallo-hydrolase [Thermoanaerobaculia bacterium]|nr:MBL fold metallo-hydrolase [Thermoanaerobaculia bacterium]
MSVTAAGKMAAPATGVKVRMVQGLGDCFLLAFPTHGPRPCYVLVDCGVQLGTAEAADRMKKAAASLAEATGGKIDVLVATREHWDHVAGFQQAKEAFDPIEIGQVWASWTEDPNDPGAQRLRTRRDIAVRALYEAVQELRQCGEEDSAGSLESVLGSFGDLGRDGRPAAVQQTMAYLFSRGKPPRYLWPGDRLELPEVDGARVYVLGPPGVAPGLAAAEETTHEAGGAELKPQSFPFEPYYRVPVDAARRDPFFQASYFGVAGQPSEHEMAWRQIETEWLTSVSHLTSQLDASANHTGLALAVELRPSGKVLLFATGALTDDWHSWHHLQWPREAPSGDSPITAEELLRHTVVYEVARRANQAAVLDSGGLDLMTDPELVVLMPADEARRPAPPLLQSLWDKARGRVLRTDLGLPPRSSQLSPGEWKAFEKRCAVTPDYVELTVAEAAAQARPKKKA